MSDTLGGVAFGAAWGVAGGVALSSVGTWGAFDAGPVIGAVGGSAIGMGSAAWVASRTPVTTGQGLAVASGTGWGLTTALWATDALHGRPRLLYYDPSRSDTNRLHRDLGAAYRLVGVAAGATLGTVWMRGQPEPADVLEVDLATYLGSAIALSATGLALYRPNAWAAESDWESPAFWDARWQATRWMDASNIAGAAVGMGVGLAMRERWELDAEDVGFAMVLGLEGAWVGSWLPDALYIRDSELKGTVRLPWNASIALGLAVAELHPMPWQTTGVTATLAGAGNAFGAGLPLVALGRPTDAEVARVMLPVGLAGTVTGVLAAPWLDPGPGEWTMTALSSGLSAYNGAAVAQALPGVDGRQVGGVLLMGAGAGAAGSLVAGHYADPRADHMLTLGSAAAWGSFYGVLAPIAAGDRLDGDLRP
ncbi:MAG: hypothetical protein KC656_01885, partial [Myxococcales bacterium]|nr:hypothetical protein [Myxococcales bacterium]